MKVISIILAFLFFIAGNQLQSCKTTTDNPTEFEVKIANKIFVGNDTEVEPIEEVIARSPADVKVASGYLLNIAIAANLTGKISQAIEKEKKVLPALWAITPILISDLPALIKASKSLKNFKAFYEASGGLTPAERAGVSEYFAAELSLPYDKANAIASATIEATLSSMNLAAAVKDAVK